MATHAASIHLRLVAVSDEQDVFLLHGALGAEKSRWGTGDKTASGHDLQGVGQNNNRSR